MAKNQTQPDDERTMELWLSVCTTDPQFQKKANNGRFDFTAIDPHYQLMKATAQWGPYGGNWGLRELAFNVAEAMHKEVPKSTLVGRGIFFYPGGQFEIFADLPFRWNDDAYKKLFTTLRSKALSLLGFDAGAFLGKFEDEQYVAEMRTKFADQDELRGTIQNAIRGCDTTERLKKVRTTLDERYRTGIINKMLHSEMLEDIEKQSKELGQAVNGQPTAPQRPTPPEIVVIREGETEPVAKESEHEETPAPPADAFTDHHSGSPMSDAEKEAALEQQQMEM